MAEEVGKDEPPVKRLKLDQEESFKNEDNIAGCSSSKTVKNSNRSNGSEESCKDNLKEEEKILEGTRETEIDNSDNVSEISNLSGLSEESWKPTSGAMMWIHKQIMSGENPRPILKGLIPDGTQIPDDIDDYILWKIVINVLSEPPARKKLENINTLQDVLHLLQTCKNIMVLTGAGVSVSCGIPDFRSRDGIYARLAVDFPDLPDPQAMFDINYFRNDPRPFFKFAKEIYPGQFEPSPSHKFIHCLEEQDKLLRNYTQNIDTLEQVAGISKIIQCHGSFATATCMMCKHKVDAEFVKEDIFNQVIPKCPVCPTDSAMSIMKPDIVFFGESLSDEFHKQMTQDKDKCDLLIVIGSSLKVRPVALIPNSLPADVPQILINREPLKHLNFDVELLGDCDTIVEELCKNLSWDKKSRSPVLQEISKDELPTPTPSELGQNDSSIEESANTSENSNLTDNQSSDNSNDNQGTSSLSEICNNKHSDVVKNGAAESDLKNNEKCTEFKNSDKSRNVDHKIENVTVLKNNNQSSNTDTQNEMSLDNVNCSSLLKQSDSISVDSALCTNSVKNENVINKEEIDHNQSNSIIHNDDTEKLSSEEPPDEDDLEIMRSMWKPRHHGSMAKRLGDKQYLFLPPSRYVFSGAEVYSDSEDDSDSDDLSSISSTSDDESDEKKDSESHSELLNGEKKEYIDNKVDCSVDTECSSINHRLNGDSYEEPDKLVNEVLCEGTNNSDKSVSNGASDIHKNRTIITKPLCKTIGGMHQHYEEFDQLESEAGQNKKIVQNGIEHLDKTDKKCI